MSLFSKQVLGVDIGHSSVKVVGLSIGKNPNFIGCKEIVMDPKYLSKEGFTKPELIAEALKEAIKTAAPKPIKPSECYISIPESLVYRKIVEISDMGDDESMAKAVNGAITDFLPGELNSMVIDYQVLGAAEGKNMLQVMAVAAPRTVIDNYLNVFKKFNVTLMAIDPKPEAVGRAIIDSDSKSVDLLIDVGSEVTTITLYNKSKIWVTGSINSGGNFVRGIAGMAEKTDEDVEVEKVRRLASNIADQAEHVLKFYANTFKEVGKVKQIKISGGGSLISGLAEAISKSLVMDVAECKPVINIPPFCDRRFYGALGSAMYPYIQKKI